jgi:dihydrofolate reductase|tara:strand:- start:38 stop:520 length:483 start_codon:yes stop_codon:yes gene_type:complete
MTISIIVAMTNNRVIGKDNEMPWHLSDDLKNFKKLTLGKTVIMGRLTYDSIGKPLPNRKNIVLSRSLKDKKVNVLSSVEVALDITSSEEEVFIIGGQDIYLQTIKKATKLYITMINSEIEGDKFFPNIDLSQWKIIDSLAYSKGEFNSHDFTAQVYIRKN